MKSAVIIGTSNSIMMSGWVNQTVDAAKDAGWTWINSSIGGSSSRFGAYRIGTQDHPDTDRIIVDFCINDQMFIDDKKSKISHVLGHYATMLMALQAKGQLDRLLVVMFPQQAVHEKMFNALTQLFDTFAVDYIDFRGVLAGWAKADGVDVTTFYNDPRHFTPDQQKRVGLHVLERIKADIRPGFLRRRTRRRLAQLPAVTYKKLSIASGPYGTETEVGTSMLRLPVTQFKHGETFLISGADYLVAAYVWCTQEAGTLTIHGPKAKRRLHLRRAFRNLFLFDTFFKPLALGDFNQVTVVNDPKAPFDRMLGQTSSIYDDSDSTVEIATLVGADCDPAVLGKAIQKLVKIAG